MHSSYRGGGLDSHENLPQPYCCLYSHSDRWYTVEPVYYGHLGTSQKCPDYQVVLIFQVSLHDNVSFGTTARCVDYAGVHIFKGPD